MHSVLPPFRPLHPAWPMVATIACVGGAVAARLAGSWIGEGIWVVLAVGAAAVSRAAIRRHRGGRTTPRA